MRSALHSLAANSARGVERLLMMSPELVLRVLGVLRPEVLFPAAAAAAFGCFCCPAAPAKGEESARGDGELEDLPFKLTLRDAARRMAGVDVPLLPATLAAYDGKGVVGRVPSREGIGSFPFHTDPLPLPPLPLLPRRPEGGDMSPLANRELALELAPAPALEEEAVPR